MNVRFKIHLSLHDNCKIIIARNVSVNMPLYAKNIATPKRSNSDTILSINLIILSLVTLPPLIMFCAIDVDTLVCCRTTGEYGDRKVYKSHKKSS